MRRSLMVRIFVGLVLIAVPAIGLAQTEGSIRGYLRDEQGAVLPGVTVTATSPTVGGTYTAVTDQRGALPPVEPATR